MVMHCEQCEIKSLLIQPFAVRKAGRIPLFTSLFVLEMVLTVTGVMLCLIALRYRKRQKVHVNHRRILANVAVSFVLMSPSRFVEIALTMNWQSDEMLDYNRVYRIADTFRCHYVMVSALMLPAAAVERFCSVLFLYDYEAVPRTGISAIVIVVVHLTAFAFALALCLLGVITVFPPMIFVFVANVGAICLFYYYHRITMRYHNANLDYLQRNIPQAYSLSARFQVTENIRVAKTKEAHDRCPKTSTFQNIKQLYIIISTLVFTLAIITTLPIVMKSDIGTALATEASFIGITAISNVVSLFVLSQIFSEFTNRCRERVARVFRRRVEDELKPCEDVDANEPLKVKAEEEARIYFNQLQLMWA